MNEGNGGRCYRAVCRVISLLALLVLTPLMSGCKVQALPLGATREAEGLHRMWSLFFVAGLAIAALVYGLLLWCIVRYRKSPTMNEYPSQFRRNNVMEIIYTVVPIIIVAVLFCSAYATERQVETLSPSPALLVDVVGYRWSWHFSYPRLHVEVAGDAPDHSPILVLPVDKTVRMNITSVDVDHSFWVPAFLFKRDAVPGLKNSFDWTPKQIGSFRGECGEFCGLNHANMTFSVQVVSSEAFRRWVLEHRS